MLRILMLGVGILMTVLADFFIDLQSLRGTVDVQKNPRVDMLLTGVIIVIVVNVV